MLVGKGPSAINAQRHNTGKVAVINDAMKLIEGPVDYCFFTDYECIEAAREHWHRVNEFICPTVLHRNWQKHSPDLPEGFPEERCNRFEYHTFHRSKFDDCLKRNVICMRTTATSAMSWLYFAGYRAMRLIGFDGGKGFAPGVIQTRPHHDYSEFRRDQLALVSLLEKRGVKFEWLT